MANIVDRVFGEVCLDERIKDGIFRMEEEEHMNALRDYFVKRGIAKEAAVSVTNRMVEGKYPERQAYNKDGILVTFPTPQHKAKAIQRGTHFEKNPAPQNTTPPRPEAEPAAKPRPKGGNEFDDGPPKDEPKDDEEDGGKSLPKSSGGNIFDDEKGSKKDPTTGGELDIEPPRGAEKPEPTPAPPQPIQQAPRTPERVAAEKAVVAQMIATDDTALFPIDPQVNEQLRANIIKMVGKLHYDNLKALHEQLQDVSPIK